MSQGEFSQPIITLLTDFGTQDGYVGAIKGLLLTMVPQARLIDITHHIESHDIKQGAWALRRAAKLFPPGTIHLAVVDPGVGSDRLPVVVHAGPYFFVGPDNGLLYPAAAEAGIENAWTITPQEDNQPWRKSDTFDGLSLFAPVAGALAQGRSPSDLGVKVNEIIALVDEVPWQRGPEVFGRVVLFDRFGNAATNITREDLSGGEVVKITLSAGNAPSILVHMADALSPRLVSSYSEITPGLEIGAVWNSDGRLELAMREASLRERLHLQGGEQVRVLLKLHI